MPLYDFQCPHGHTFEEIVPVTKREHNCPQHGTLARRLFPCPVMRTELAPYAPNGNPWSETGLDTDGINPLTYEARKAFSFGGG